MDDCQAEFSSKETGSSLVETKALIKAITDKKVFIQQATEVVLSQGRKLQDVLTQSRTLWPTIEGRSGSNVDLSKLGRDNEEDPVPRTSIRKAQSTDDLLEEPMSVLEVQRSRTMSYREGNGQETGSNSSTGVEKHKPPKQMSLDTERRYGWDVLDSRDSNRSPEQLNPVPQGSPRVLFTPRRTRAVLKAATSVPALNVNQNQQVVQTFMVRIDGRLNQLILLWEGRRKGLEEAQRAVEFQEAVPQILEWIDTVGAEFLKKYSHYGRSMEEVREGG